MLNSWDFLMETSLSGEMCLLQFAQYRSKKYDIIWLNLISRPSTKFLCYIYRLTFFNNAQSCFSISFCPNYCFRWLQCSWQELVWFYNDWFGRGGQRNSLALRTYSQNPLFDLSFSSRIKSPKLFSDNPSQTVSDLHLRHFGAFRSWSHYGLLSHRT